MPRLRFQHSDLLTNDLTMIINGRRNIGKTTLLFNMLTTPGILDFNNLMIYSKTNEQFLYRFLRYGFENNLKKEWINHLLKVFENDNNLEENDIKELCKSTAEKYPDSVNREEISVLISNDINKFEVTKLNKNKKNIMCFDDSSSDRDQSIQTSFFQKGRHFNCAVIYLTHRFHEPMLKPIRGNTSVFCLFEISQKILQEIYRDINLCMGRQEFYQLASSAWSDPEERNYLLINTESSQDKRVLVSPFRF